jgi:hypothetical protein
MNRKQKIEALQKVFETGNKALLERVGKMVIHSVVVEKDGWFQIIEIKPTFEIPNHELTFKKFDLSTWTNEQLEARLFELENKDHEQN